MLRFIEQFKKIIASSGLVAFHYHKSYILLLLVSLLTFQLCFADEQNPQRIISLSPSVTETLFALDEGDRLIGVTKCCKYPPKAQQKQSVGGLLDPNMEVIYRLNPDLLIYTEGAQSFEDKFKKMGFNCLRVDATRVQGILESIDLIGREVVQEEKAEVLRKSIESKIKKIQLKLKDLPKPRVLIVYDRPLGTGVVRDAYIAGNNTFFNDLLEIVGGQNAFQGTQLIISPLVSAEGILQIDPDVIIEIKGGLEQTPFTKEDLLNDWKALSSLKAYQNNQIYILTQDYIGIPGPRIGQTIETLARCVHPDVDWNDE